METNPADVSSIQDEEVLRRMWQQTADFGKKKEIRTHMYKLREARLKEFYTSGEVMKDVQRSNSSPGLREQHTKNQQWQEGPTHADSLADHSFLSLKSKEIRDSESPTRDVQYRNAKNRGGDGAWTISSSTEKTDDGKMVKSALVATTQGSRAIDGGNLSFAAANEQQTSVYSDGDANNFTKSLGESSKTFAHQDVTVGDDKNYQSTKSTTSSSSSKFVSHHSSTTGDKFDTQNIDNKQIGDGRASTVVTKKVYSSDIPDDLKKDILDGKTKVITETKTLPDGSTVTTTRYETKGAKKWSSSSSSNQVSSSRQVMEERSSSNKQVEYATGDNNQQAVKRTTVVTNVKDGADNIRQIQPDERTEIIRSTKSEAFQDNSSKTSEQVNVSRTQESVRDVQEQHEVHRRTEDVRDNITNRKVVQKHDMLDGSQITDDVKVTRIITQTVEPDYIQPVQRKPVPDTEETHTRVTTTKTTRSDVSQKSDDNRMTHIETVKRHEHNESPQIDKIEYVKSQPDKKQVTSTTTTVHETYTVPSTPKEVKPKPVRPSDSDTTRTHSETTEVTDTHRRNIEPPFVPLSSRPDKSQPSKKPTPTPTETPIEPLQPCSKGTSTDRDQNISTTAQEYELNRQGRCESPAFKESQPSDQYTTTYRTDFPNKRITVDVSPTHDAFARSLRSVSPDRVGHRPGSSPPSRASNRSLRTSSSSLRSSPEKTTSKPSRVSPDRKPTPDRYSPDRRTRDKSYSPERRAQSPTKSPERKKYPEQTESPFSHDRHTKTKPDSKRKTSSTPYYSRTPSPTKPGDRQSSVKPSDRHSPAKQSPTRITEITTTSKITRNQTSPERAPKTSPSRSTSPQKATSPVKSPTKSPTEPYVINTDTITRKKKVPTDDVSTKTNDVTVTKTTEVVNTDTITRRKETSPGARRSPTKSTDSPTRSPSKPTTETSPKKQSPVSDDTKPTPQDYKPRQSPTKSAPTPTEYMPCKPAGTKPKPTRSRSSSPTSSASDIEFISHNSHIITDLDAEDTINITLRKTDDSIIISQITTQTNDTVTTDKRPTSLNITTTKTSPRKPDASTSETPKSPTKSPTKPTKSSPTKEVRKITEYTDEYTSKTSPDRKSPVKETKSKTQETKITTDQHTDYKTEYTEQYPKKQQPKKPVQPDDICSNPDDYEPGVKPQFKRTGTYEEQCKKMLGLLETTTKPKDEYAGREPVEEPLFVKKHIDISCREDELMQETIEKITKQKTSTDTDRPKIDVPKEEVIDFIRTEKDDVTVKQYSQTEHKPDSEKPTSPVKASSPDRKSPEKTSTKKVPTREAPKESPDKKPHEPSPTKIPLQSPTKTPSKTFPQTTEQKQKPEKSPERKTPSETSKPQEKGRASPEKPLQKPSEKRKPDDDDEDKPEITKMKQTKTTNIEDVNIQERSEYHKTVEDVCFTGVDKTEFTTEYTDEYTEKLTTVPKTQDKSPTRKPTTSPDRKPTRESPSPDRKKSPKKKPSDVTKDSEFVTEEISVVTKTTKQTGKKHKKPKPTDKDTDEETETDEELDTEKINVYDIEETEKHEQVLVSSSVEDVTKRTRTDYIEENICRIPKMTSRKEPQDVEKSPQKQYKPEDDTKPHQKPGKKIIKEVQLEAGELSLTIDTADLIETHIDFIDTIPGDKQPRLTKPIDDQTEIQKITETHYRVTQKGPEEKPIDDEDYLIKCHKLTNTRKDEKQTTEEFLTTESTSSKTRQETNIIKTSDVISRDKKHTKETSPTRKEPRKQPDTKEPREGETTDRKSPSKSPVKEIKQTKPSRPTTEVKEPDDYKPKELPDRTTASLERKSSKKEITSKETVERIRELVNIESNKTEYTDEYTEKSLPYFDRKSPEKQPKSKEPEERLPEDYTTEYTNEYTPKPTSPGRKSPTKQTKQPETKLPTEKQPSDYTTEYTKEYPEKQPPVRKTTSPDRKTPLKDKEPQMKPAIEKPQKEHETEYTDEYCSKKTPQRKTTSPDRKPQTDVKPKEPTKKPEEIQPKEEHHAPKKSAQPKPAEIPKSPSKKLVTERKPSKEIPLESKPQAKTITKTTTRDQKVTSTHTTNYDTKIENKETKPTKKATDKYPSEKPTKATPKQDELPKRKSVTKDDEDLKPKQANEIVIDYTDDNLRVNKSYRTDTTKFVTSDFIGQERYDTEITLDVTNLTEPSKTRPRDDLNIEYEHPQKPHIRTHRIDTNITDIEEGETIPKRQPHKAVPSETTECTFITKQNVNENVVNITSTRKTEDIKTKIKEKKTDTVQQKLPVQNKPIKKDTLVRGSPTFDKPETRKPDHARPSSPATKVTTKQVTETEKTTHVTTRKLSPVKKPDAKPKMLDTPKASTPKTNEPVTRRSTQTSPVETAEKKPIARPTSRAPTKDSPQSRPNDLSKKHIVMKTVSLTSRTETKQPPAGKTPKVVTTTKTTRVTQPASVTVTTVRTTTKASKPKKPGTEYFESEPEQEDINEITETVTSHSKSQTDKKRVVTTTDIKLTSPVRERHSPVRDRQSPVRTGHSPVRERPSATTELIINTTKKPSVTVTSKTKKEKCITTKSIVLNKKDTETREVIIDLQRSTSSREPSPEKIYPVAVSSEDESGHPRYPDQISEPDDSPSRKPPFKIHHIPLTEEEDVDSFSRITDVTETKTPQPTRISGVDKVNETDESLLSVTEKVSRFITTAEKLTGDSQPKAKVPAPKVPRPELVVTEDLENDECLLSVSDKVNKFINTADEVTTTKQRVQQTPSTDHPVDVKVDKDDECLLSVYEKVTHFIQAAETVKKPLVKDTPTSKPARPQITDIDEGLKTDECLLSVSDKVSKFLNTTEQVTTDKFIATEKITSTQQKQSPRQSPEKVLPDTTKSRQSPTRKVPEFSKKPDDAEPLPTSTTRQQSPIRKIPETTQLKSPISIRDRKPEPTSDNSSKPIRRESPTRKYTGKPSETDDEKISRQSPIRKIPEQIQTKPAPIDNKRRPEIDTSKNRQSPIRKIPDDTSSRPISIQKQPADDKHQPSSITKITGVETKTINLKSSEAVRKAKAMFENISKNQEVPRQRDILSRPSIWEGRKIAETKKETTTDTKQSKVVDVKTDERKHSHISEVRKHLTYTSDDDENENICKRTDLKDVSLKSTKLVMGENKTHKTEQDYKVPHKPRYPSPERSSMTTTDLQKPDEQDMPHYMTPIPKVTSDDRDRLIIESRHVTQERQTFTQQKYSTDDEMTTMSETKSKTRLHTDDMPGYMRPLHRCPTPEHEPHRRPETKEDVPRSTTPKLRHTSPETEMPGYMKPLQRCTSPERDLTDGVYKHRKLSSEGEMPHYMRPLQRQTSPDREPEHKTSPERKGSREVPDDAPRAVKKFGVTLRRTDSGRAIATAITERRRSSVPGQPVIEDIQDLKVLEEMMDKVVGYEQRRRIRAQIRVVKRLISENKIPAPEDRQKKKKPQSPTREPPSQYTRKSPEKDVKKVTEQTTVRKIETENKYDEKHSTEQKIKYTEVSQERHSQVKKETQITRDEIRTSLKEERMSPDSKKKDTPTSNLYKTELKPVQPATKIITEEKPSWITNRNLKKTATESASEERRVTVSLKKKEAPRKSPSPQKDVKPIDCITSSYGIGPTDENGQPLFGIKALRRAAADKVHVRGTVVTSQFYSENGQEPVGEVSVTKYSSDPKELECDNELISKSPGFASVTTTQKFGTRGTPSLKTIIDKKKQITELEADEEETKTTTAKVTRRGSVKALSQKFVDNAVETSRNERQSYPKAGLILRTSSFKDTAQSTEKSVSRESSPGLQGRTEKISLETITADSRTTKQEEAKTFLNSHTKVASAQEVITRMKNSEHEIVAEDTAEDKEARMLLNKFLGAQVLMTGMEPLVGGQTGSSSSHHVRKMQTSRTVKETSKPVTVSKRYQCPITPEVLQDIWEEQTLRALLEQCTNYEERRHIRARLRQVMAEQEAVANVVASAVAERECDLDRTSSSTQERTETKKTYSEGPVTTTEVSTRLITSTRQVSKPMSPFAKFRQLDKQNSLNTPPSSPRTPGGGCGAPLFKFTDPALSHSASTVKDRLLHWCQMKTREYQNIKLENFSSSWADGLAFCALIHHFLPDAFDYHALNPQQRRHNFTLAFKVADEQAGIYPLLDVDDMVTMKRPDWKCVFTYVQSIYRRFKDED